MGIGARHVWRWRRGGPLDNLSGARGQAVIETTFSMIIVVIMALAVLRFFLWSMEDMTARRQAHTDVLLNTGKRNKCDGTRCAAMATRPKFFEYVPPQAEIAK